MKEISTTISCYKDKQKNLLQVVVGIVVYQNGKKHSTKLKRVSSQIHIPKSRSSLKQWFQGIS